MNKFDKITHLMPIIYDNYKICNHIIYLKDRYYEVIDNRPKLTECAIALQDAPHEVPDMCIICQDDTLYETLLSGKVLLSANNADISFSNEEQNISAFPVLISFNDTLKIGKKLLKRYMTSSEQYTTLAEKIRDRLYMLPDDYIRNFLHEYFEIISIPGGLFIILLVIVLIITICKNKINERAKLTGKNRRLIKAIKRKNTSRHKNIRPKRRKANIIEMVHP